MTVFITLESTDMNEAYGALKVNGSVGQRNHFEPFPDRRQQSRAL